MHLATKNQQPRTNNRVWQRTEKGVRLRVRAQPRSSRSRVTGVHGDALKVQLAAPPVEGAANEELLEVLSKWLAVARRQLQIVQGQGSRNKVVEVTTSSAAELETRLEEALRHLVDKPRGHD